MDIAQTLDLTAVGLRDVLPVGIAFVLGFGARQIGLPPLVGFLIAGFLLGALGLQSSDGLQEIADIGVSLLLFTIGLKLKLRQLLSPSVWAAATVHMVLTVALATGLLLLLAVTGISLFSGIDP
ncbi:MAG: potassium transporter Kef, partial [Gammaproteobacteria bacterium]|nr:potassium transporter Kef [Gammaproteobacteria bacterium]